MKELLASKFSENQKIVEFGPSELQLQSHNSIVLSVYIAAKVIVLYLIVCCLHLQVPVLW